MKKHIAVSLLNRMRDQLVADNTAINVKILKVSLAARKSRQAYPTPQSHARRLALNKNRILDKRWAAN